MKKLLITEEEKNRILRMHKNAILNEQDPNTGNKPSPMYYGAGTPLPDAPMSPIEGEKVKGKENEYTLPEVTVSAWLPMDSAVKEAQMIGSQIFLYVYNNGCTYCENKSQQLLENKEFRKLTSEDYSDEKKPRKHLVYAKLNWCTTTSEGVGWTAETCNSQDQATWDKYKHIFENETPRAVPAYFILSPNGKNVNYTFDASKVEDVVEELRECDWPYWT